MTFSKKFRHEDERLARARELLRLIRESESDEERAAFRAELAEIIYESVYERTEYIVRDVSGRRETFSPTDITNQVFERYRNVVPRIDQLSDEDSYRQLTGACCMVANSVFFDRWRSQYRRQKMLDKMGAIATSHIGPIEWERDENAERVAAAISELANDHPQLAEIVKLKYWGYSSEEQPVEAADEKTIREIASTMGLSKSSVHAQLKEALRLLKIKLRELKP